MYRFDIPASNRMMDSCRDAGFRRMRRVINIVSWRLPEQGKKENDESKFAGKSHKQSLGTAARLDRCKVVYVV